MATDAKPTYADLTRSGADRGQALALLRGLWLPAGLLFVSLLALYWLTRTQYYTFDAVSYANQIGRLYPQTHDRHWLFHPHHLLFNATGYLLWRFARALGYIGGPLVVLQRQNAVLGAAGVTVFYLTLRRLMQRSRGLPLLLSFGLAFAFGYWICATDGRVNMPSVVLLITAFAVLVRLMQNVRPALAAGVGALAGAAVLYHESAGLFFLVGLAGVLLTAPDPMRLPQAARRDRVRMLLAYLGAWTATVVLPYFLVATFGLGLHSWAAFRHWTSTYSDLGWWWNFQIPHNIRLDGYALRRVAFNEPPGKQGTFHLSASVPLALRVLYYATLAGWFVAAWTFFRALPLLWRSHHRPTLVICTLWIGLYAAFFTVWNPGYYVFWVPVLIPISVLLALVASHYRAKQGGIWVNGLVGLWIALSATVNAVASVGPHLKAASDPFQRAAADIRAQTRPGDLIVVAGAGDGGQVEVDIPYFANRDVVSVHTSLARARDNKPDAWAAIQTAIDRTLASGHAVYAYSDVWFNSHTRADLHKHHKTLLSGDLDCGTTRPTAFGPYVRELAWTGPRGKMWRLEHKP